MKKINVGICISVEGKIKDETLKACKILKDEFNARYICETGTCPHLTLSIGQCYKKDYEKLCTTLKNTLEHTKKFKLKSSGLGIFLSDSPVLYIRYLRSKKLLSLKKSIDESLKDIWLPDKQYNSEEVWLPKSTIAFRDMPINKITSIANKLKNKSFVKEVYANNVSIILFDENNEKYDFKIKL